MNAEGAGLSDFANSMEATVKIFSKMVSGVPEFGLQTKHASANPENAQGKMHLQPVQFQKRIPKNEYAKPPAQDIHHQICIP